jgi:hypothetical protein
MRLVKPPGAPPGQHSQIRIGGFQGHVFHVPRDPVFGFYNTVRPYRANRPTMLNCGRVIYVNTASTFTEHSRVCSRGCRTA